MLSPSVQPLTFTKCELESVCVKFMRVFKIFVKESLSFEWLVFVMIFLHGLLHHQAFRQSCSVTRVIHTTVPEMEAWQSVLLKGAWPLVPHGRTPTLRMQKGVISVPSAFPVV